MLQTRSCDDCFSENIYSFMILDELWLTVAKKKDILCLACFERRLGRKITLYDLKPCDISYWMWLGAYVGQNFGPLPPDGVLLHPGSFTTQKNWDHAKIQDQT